MPRNEYFEESSYRSHFSPRPHLAPAIDEDLSRKLLIERVKIEKILLEGVPLDEGHSTVEDVATKVLERARRMSHGYVVAVVYTDLDDEVVLAGRNGRIAIAVDGKKKLHGHEALQLYRRARGDYIIMAGEDF